MSIISCIIMYPWSNCMFMPYSIMIYSVNEFACICYSGHTCFVYFYSVLYMLTTARALLPLYLWFSCQLTSILSPLSMHLHIELSKVLFMILMCQYSVLVTCRLSILILSWLFIPWALSAFICSGSPTCHSSAGNVAWSPFILRANLLLCLMGRYYSFHTGGSHLSWIFGSMKICPA